MVWNMPLYLKVDVSGRSILLFPEGSDPSPWTYWTDKHYIALTRKKGLYNADCM